MAATHRDRPGRIHGHCLLLLRPTVAQRHARSQRGALATMPASHAHLRQHRLLLRPRAALHAGAGRRPGGRRFAAALRGRGPVAAWQPPAGRARSIPAEQVQVDARDARPCWARAIAMSLHDARTVLQLDSHMDFDPGWDDTLASCPALGAPQRPLVISSYPMPSLVDGCPCAARPPRVCWQVSPGAAFALTTPCSLPGAAGEPARPCRPSTSAPAACSPRGASQGALRPWLYHARSRRWRCA
jgi:hypothetical protein